MTFQNVKGYQFEIGYSLNTTGFNNVSAVYLIYTSNRWLDIGETDKLGNRLENHERKGCWEKNSLGDLIYVGVHQEIDQNVRLNIEADLRSKLNPFCGIK